MPQDIAKTLSFLMLHLLVGFSVAYVFTGDVTTAGGIALIEPCVNAVVFFFHERAWKGEGSPFQHLLDHLTHRAPHGAKAA